jgi:hypothetical protein
MFHQELCIYHGINYKVDDEDITIYLEHRVLRNLGSNQIKIYGSTNSDTSKLVVGISYAHKCIIIGSRWNVGTKPNW